MKTLYSKLGNLPVGLLPDDPSGKGKMIPALPKLTDYIAKKVLQYLQMEIFALIYL